MKPAARTDYRERLYTSYVSSGQAARDPSRSAVGLARQIVAHLPQDRRARILDAGCGHGGLMLQLREAGYTNLAGVDVSSEQVALARSRGVGDVVEGDLLDYLADHPAHFDAIMAVDVLEHFDPPEVLRVLDLLRSALVPGGRLVARSPNADGPFSGRYRYGDFTHGVVFTQRSVRQIFAACGYVDVEVFGTPPVVHGARSVGRVMVWKAIEALLRLYLAAELGTTSREILTQNLIAVGRRG